MKIIYTNDEGNLCVVTPSAEWLNSGKTLQQLAIKDVPAGKEFAIIQDDEIPDDRYFRNAWAHDNGNVDIDIDKARCIHLDVLRQERNRKLQDLDIDMVIALGKQDSPKIEEIEQIKQQLRDMPPVAIIEMGGINDLDLLKEYKPGPLNNE